MTKKTFKFEPTVCPCCQMTIDYVVSLDKGTADLLLAMIKIANESKKNEVYIQGGVDNGDITPMQAGNLTKARANGLIAPVRDKNHYYLITRKGAEFLQGRTIPRHAILSKKDGCQIGYFHPEELTINIKEAESDNRPYWDFLKNEYPASAQAGNQPGELEEKRSWQFASQTNKSKIYTVIYWGNTYTCNCEGFQYHRECRHVTEAKNQVKKEVEKEVREKQKSFL